MNNVAKKFHVYHNFVACSLLRYFDWRAKAEEKEVKNNGCLSGAEIGRMLNENRNNLISFWIFLVFLIPISSWGLFPWSGSVFRRETQDGLLLRPNWIKSVFDSPEVLLRIVSYFWLLGTPGSDSQLRTSPDSFSSTTSTQPSSHSEAHIKQTLGL